MRKWSRSIHRHLSFFFAGIIVIYAASGLFLNHKRDINPDYIITRDEISLKGTFPHPKEMDKPAVIGLLEQVGEQKAYAKHYYYDDQKMKIFIKGGSVMEVDMNSGKAVYEKLQKRPVISYFNKLHQNPHRWWTWFSDIFAISLLIITVTGMIMLKGKRGLIGIGGIEFIAGILVPLIFFFFLK